MKHNQPVFIIKLCESYWARIRHESTNQWKAHTLWKVTLGTEIFCNVLNLELFSTFGGLFLSSKKIIYDLFNCSNVINWLIKAIRRSFCITFLNNPIRCINLFIFVSTGLLHSSKSLSVRRVASPINFPRDSFMWIALFRISLHLLTRIG